MKRTSCIATAATFPNKRWLTRCSCNPNLRRKRDGVHIRSVIRSIRRIDKMRFSPAAT